MDARLRILAVDDEPDIPTLLRSLLEPEFEVVEASNGLDALLKLPRYEPDILIVDISMPLMDGWELARHIRQHPQFSQTPIIFLTALDSQKDIRKGYESGAAIYLTKPFDPERVRKNVRIFSQHDQLKPRPKQQTLQAIRLEEARQASEKTQKLPVASPQGAVRIIRKVGSRPGASPEVQATDKAGVESVAESPSREYPPHAVLGKTGERTWASPLPPPAPRSPLARLPLPPRVMIVDDDPQIIELVGLALKRGFEVVAACDGLDALKKIPDSEPDIFILDLMMPKMSGLQLLQVIRQSRDTARIPIVILSAKTSPKDQKYALSLGATVYLTKPFNPETMVAHLEKIASQPDFIIHFPKKLTLNQILSDEGEKRADEEEIEKRKSYWKTQDAIGEFLRQHGDKDPMSRQ